MNKTQQVKKYFNSIADKRDIWKIRNNYYHKYLENFCRFLIPKDKLVLEIGCGTGDLLASVEPKKGLGIDIADQLIKKARIKYPSLKFEVGDAQNLSLQDKFDYIIASDLIGNLDDVQRSFEELHKVASARSRIIITYYNFLWEPFLKIAEKLNLKMPQPWQNWLSSKDIENLLFLADLEVIKMGTMLLIPIYIPLISTFMNKYIAKLPIIRKLCLVSYFIVRKTPTAYLDQEYLVSIIIPARNEKGNIEQIILRTPKIGSSMEFIFVEGWSNDGTLEEIRRVMNKYKEEKQITVIEQGKNGVGKADAVRKGFAQAKGEIIMILDADLTVPPEDLIKFYHALRRRKGELIDGSRLVYQMEDQAMRFLNILGNKFFSIAFSWLLDQPIKDTLCGTKAIFRKDYNEIAKDRAYFGDFDPFGDFDLIFGACKLNLKITEIPIRYKARTYGLSNISRFKHGWLLLKMTIVAARKIKFIL